MRKSKGKKFFFLGLALITAFIFLLASFWWHWALAAKSQTGKNKVFVIRRGEGLSLIANRLEKEGLIRSSFAFKVFTLTKGLASQIQAGSFHLNPSLTLKEIALLLTHGTLDVWVTFPEGWRREEFARRLAANLENFDEEEFLVLTKNLEGSLFPDTYLFPKSASAAAVVKTLTANFEKKTTSLKLNRQRLILASIVEREVRYDEDRPLVAGILVKRWQNNWPLQADATIQYLLANIQHQSASRRTNPKYNWWPKIKKDDLQIDSPYNTYKYKGLPPTPISNPGLASIKAAVSPQESDYWFYLSDSDGKIHYAKTIEEHNQNIVKYLR